MAKKVFVIDVARCNGCHNCQIVCKDEHVGNDWSPIAKPQPDIGHFWLELTEEVRGTVPKVKVAYRPHLCMHCGDAPCIAACPVPDAAYQREDGMVILDGDVCTGCRLCVEACPYNAIFYNEGLRVAQKCTGCAHLLDDGWAEPRCADACPTEAIKLVDEDEAQELMAKGETWAPKFQTDAKPRLYYLNLPKRFIAGTVYEPEEEEVVIGATATLTGTDGTVLTRETDAYGDFWFEGIEKGVYDLELAYGGKVLSFAGLDTSEKDINLGDIPLSE